MSIHFECQCGFAMSAADRHAGLLARCSRCKALIKVPGTPPPGMGEEGIPILREDGELIAPEPEAGDATGASVICPSCGEEVEAAEAIACIACRGLFHLRCWERAGGCTVATCVNGPQSRKRTLRAANKQTTERHCPACGGVIPDRAQRCRHCGVHVDPTDNTVLARKRVRRRTSKLAAYSLIGGIVCFFLAAILIAYPSALIIPVGFGAFASLVMAVAGIVVISRRENEFVGLPLAVIGLCLGMLNGFLTLMALIRLV